jgi:hypothetical protein
MYTLLSKLLLSGKMKFNIGRINMFGDAMVIISANSLKKMSDDAMQNGKKGIMDLYLQGWAYGFKITLDLSKSLKLKTFEDKYRISMDIISLIGFGDYKTVSYRKGNAYWKVLNNPFAMQYYKTDKMVDHYLRGVNAGGGTIVQDNLMYCIEKECTAQNGKYCLQANLETKLLGSVDKKIVDEQLDINYLIPKQREIIESCGQKPEDYSA